MVLISLLLLLLSCSFRKCLCVCMCQAQFMYLIYLGVRATAETKALRHILLAGASLRYIKLCEHTHTHTCALQVPLYCRWFCIYIEWHNCSAKNKGLKRGRIPITLAIFLLLIVAVKSHAILYTMSAVVERNVCGCGATQTLGHMTWGLCVDARREFACLLPRGG